MSNSLMKRILDALGFAVVNFIIFSVMYKLFLYREDWLSFSIVWSISWTVGRFVTQSIAILEKGVWFNIITDVVIIVIVFILGAFIMGVLLNIAQWKDILASTLVPFGLGLIITNVFKKCNED